MYFVLLLILIINILITFKTCIEKTKDGFWEDAFRNLFISFTLAVTILIVLFIKQRGVT